MKENNNINQSNFKKFIKIKLIAEQKQNILSWNQKKYHIKFFLI